VCFVVVISRLTCVSSAMWRGNGGRRETVGAESAKWANQKEKRLSLKAVCYNNTSDITHHWPRVAFSKVGAFLYNRYGCVLLLLQVHKASLSVCVCVCVLLRFCLGLFNLFHLQTETIVALTFKVWLHTCTTYCTHNTTRACISRLKHCLRLRTD